MAKIRVGILFGGKSAEHEVSLQSAKNIFDALDKDKYDCVLIGISKTGRWLLQEQAEFLLNASDPRTISLNGKGENVVLAPESGGSITNISSKGLAGKIDVAFPILHGPFGEDGTVQGLLKLAGIPFVGAGILGSAVGMDKDAAKRLLRDAGINVCKFLTVRAAEKHKLSFSGITNTLGLPFFIKPANMGSSVGVSKVHNEAEYETAINRAFEYDNKIIIEEFVPCREIECSVLDTADRGTIASIAGEITSTHEFYSYDAKYLDENGAVLEIPAKLPEELMIEVKRLAIDSFKALCCEGLARVDFFLHKSNGKLFVNEINTMPGFTRISMYPKLWEASGINYRDLIDMLIANAFDRFANENKLKTSY
ncbi:D-alanine--D-alanine ligase [Spirochaetia bacterium]|nr:D-alanine--D-alanine ligase [Spirochaetia bacterium]